MSSAPIVKTSYPNLFGPGTGYAILAQSGITSAATVTVNNGVYGTANGVITGTFIGTADNSASHITAANAELGNLVSAINAITATATYPSSGTFNAGIKYTSTSTINPSGTLTFNATNPNDQFFIVTPASISIQFNNPINIILNGGAQAGNIFWLANSSGLISTISGLTSTIQGNLISGTAVTIGGSNTINGNIFAQGTNVTFAANTTLNAQTVCYLKGTNILTETGYKKIEDLMVGDKVVTKGEIHNNEFYNPIDEYSFSPIKWIGNFTAPNLNEDTLPICIQANAFQENQPYENLYVSPGHRILINGKLICSRDLVNGNTIYQDSSLISVEYYHFELESHSSVIANGVLTESFLDLHNYTSFINNTNISTNIQLEPIMT
jgi:hypothetical protein